MKCEICGKECNELSKHIKSHKIKSKDYYDKYLKKENEGFCLECKKEVKFCSIKYGYYKFCSNKCIGNSKEIQKKKENTNINHCGFKYPMQSKKIHTEQKKTMINKYGYEYASQSPLIKKKIENTNLNHHSVKNPMQSEKVKEKYKQTCITNLGYDHPSKSPEIKVQKEETNLKRYGFKYPFLFPKFKEKYKNTSIKHCGFKHPSQSIEGKQIRRKNILLQRFKQGNYNEPLFPTIGKEERLCLDKLELILNCFIERNIDINGYYPDGRILHLRLLLEFDEPNHYINGYSQKDIEREIYLASQGYIIFRIKQIDWNQNKEKIIQNLKQLIEFIPEVIKI